MKTITEKLQLLKETVDHYSVNPKKRRCGTNDRCRYSPITLDIKTSKGCAVGRLLDPALALKIDRQFEGVSNSSVSGVWKHIPSNIQSFGKEFLRSLQILHDADAYWTEDGISDAGTNYCKEIKEKILSERY